MCSKEMPAVIGSREMQSRITMPLNIFKLIEYAYLLCHSFYLECCFGDTQCSKESIQSVTEKMH